LELRYVQITMPTRSKKSQFLLLLRQPPGGAPPPAELKKIMAQFQTWMDGLRARHEVLSTNGLVPTTGKVLRDSQGLSETDGPYIEGYEVIGGYVLLAADSFEEAVAAGRSCPGLNNHMSVEVRSVSSSE
jgi:hypothetical protein